MTLSPVDQTNEMFFKDSLTTPMKSATTKFLTLVFILTIVCAALQWVWNNQMPEKMRLYDGYWLLGIFAVSVTAVHLLMLNSKKGPGNSFITAFMLSTTLKFFFYLTVLAAFLLYSKDNKQTLVIHFLFYYAVFNILEISMLYKEAKKK
jgi:hypothetical protein